MITSKQQLPDIFKNEWVSLFLMSWALIFFEVLLIRLVASEIRICSFFKNLVLIAAIVGMGLGCATGGRSEQKKTEFWFPLLIAILAGILANARTLELTNISFLFTLDEFTWDFFVPSITALLRNAVSLLLIFTLIIVIFDLLGRQLGKELAGKSPLPAYSVNLIGSLVGVISYSILCYFALPPLAWFAIGFLTLIPFCKRIWQYAVLLLSIGLIYSFTNASLWSPYYRIDVQQSPPLTSANSGKDLLGQEIYVNHDVHQRIYDLSNETAAKFPRLKETVQFATYALPYEAVPHPKRVLVMGAGSGNDVAAALRHGAQSVDAVEIDPIIVDIGRANHPEKPYSDPRVHVFIQDARTFLASSKNNYDLIVFGHVDSHTAFSALSSVRLDNYLYTRESLEAATRRLSDNGVAALSFAAGRDWLRARLYQLVKSAAGAEPLVLSTKFDNT